MKLISQLEMLSKLKEKKKIYLKIRKILKSKYRVVMECGTVRLKWNTLQINLRGLRILSQKNKLREKKRLKKNS